MGRSAKGIRIRPLMLSGTCGSVAIKAEFGEFQQECTSRDTFRIGRRVRAESLSQRRARAIDAIRRDDSLIPNNDRIVRAAAQAQTRVVAPGIAHRFGRHAC